MGGPREMVRKKEGKGGEREQYLWRNKDFNIKGGRNHTIEHSSKGPNSVLRMKGAIGANQNNILSKSKGWGLQRLSDC